MATKTKSTRVDSAYDRLKTDILESDLPPGFQAPEPDIAERLGMSRTPVREALIRLEAAGLVQLVPRRGAKVLALSLDDMLEICDILLVLEPAALSNMAGRTVNSDALDVLEAIIGDLERACAEGDLDAWSIADEKFHRKLLSMSGNRRLAEFAGQLMDQLHRGRGVLLRMQKEPVFSAQDHRDLLAAILSGEADVVAERARKKQQHIRETLENTFKACRLTYV
ncbi:GntR family transcriptional regulator [Roseibium sp.]|uniref:GntR family transcriptional regulator n=1 Tax=Roseibium sp. TaxID=1936156 RepID=UPI003A984743